ncbi:hypothetical protein AX16_006952 [Volvariella volvacea WC 439]|nr:hypothetical protein AX16_006952 [Volvariella volvacea WC 439]
MDTTEQELAGFLDWFTKNGGTIDRESVGFMDFPLSEGGRGAFAKRDIPAGHALFTIPRSLTLSTRTSTLPGKFGKDAWNERKLNEGWAGLILCMMWEAASGASSKWNDYLEILPTKFDTPMFWNQEELDELKGTSIVEKLGRDEAERDYSQKVLPAVQSRPDLFPPDRIPTHYTLEAYHIMGSRILSRSFEVERWNLDDEEEEGNTTGNANDSSMDVDPPSHDGADHEERDEDGEEVDASDISMVPMADMLNARYGHENAKLFYEENFLGMISTQTIRAGEQIWNTYGDLPNSELLRRYGHVDVIPLLGSGQGNPGDVVEIRADLVVAAVEKHNPSLDPESSRERIDWWLEEGGDDVFVLEADNTLPEASMALIRLLFLSPDEFKKVQGKGKPPKPKVDVPTLETFSEVLENRLKEYPTSRQEDEEALSSDPPLNKRNALIVRIGEKRLLEQTLAKVKTQLAKEREKAQAKRKGDEEGGSRSKKTRR